MSGCRDNTGSRGLSREFIPGSTQLLILKAQTCASKTLKLFVALAAWPRALAARHECEPSIPDCRGRPLLGHAAIALLRPGAPFGLRSCHSAGAFETEG